MLGGVLVGVKGVRWGVCYSVRARSRSLRERERAAPLGPSKAALAAALFRLRFEADM